MVVLVVDDQINVVSGIIFGVKWKNVGVHKVLKAYHALEAKQIISNQEVDIMLCDIEMPVENGLQLFRWVKEQKKEIECIFLTAHADFIYAKEAMLLGSFDYILQPARYCDIEDAILNVTKKIKSKRELNKYYSYGRMLYDQKDRFMDALLQDWFLNKNDEMSSILIDFEKLNIQIHKETPLYIILINFMKWEDGREMWESELLFQTLHNILSELFECYEQNTLLFQLEPCIYGDVVYPKSQFIMEDMLVERELEHFMEVATSFFECSISCYSSEKIMAEGVPNRVQKLLRMKKDNVALSNKVFFYGRCEMDETGDLLLPNMKIWTSLIMEGYPGVVNKEAISYLDERLQEGELNSQTLKQFYQEFMKMVYNVAEKLHYSVDEILGEEDSQDNALPSYSSVEGMKNLIHYVTSYFNCPIVDVGETQKQIEQIKQFINENLDQDIRRLDIAKAVFLNPNYLSRLFKNEEGISLKAYIVNEKMQMAQALLKTTNLSVSMIAVKIGYSNFSHFSQVYKKVMGISPTDERN